MRRREERQRSRTCGSGSGGSGLGGPVDGFFFFYSIFRGEHLYYPPPLIRVNAGVNTQADCLRLRETIFDHAKIMYVVVCDIVEQVASTKLVFFRTSTKLVKKHYDVIANQC